MQDRINKLIAMEKLTPSKFAELIGVQRSSISHILSGRNKPSFDVIQFILKRFSNINAEWLILGTGDMYKKPVQINLFDHPPAFPEPNRALKKDSGTSLTDKIEGKLGSEPMPNSNIENIFSKSEFKDNENAIFKKNIEKVLIFYTDKTFTEYTPT